MMAEPPPQENIYDIYWIKTFTENRGTLCRAHPDVIVLWLHCCWDEPKR